MVLTHPFHCPTKVIDGENFKDALVNIVGARSCALVTSKSWVENGVAQSLNDRLDGLTVVLPEVVSNPGTAIVRELSAALPSVEIVIALGGGSVIDAAKGAVALYALDNDFKYFMSHLTEGTLFPEKMAPLPIIAVPTTAGTGSEITRWGTIWGDDLIKYSVNDPRLYPTHAILDHSLCQSMPWGLTLSTGLDALSHAMEAVWNRRHNLISDGIAQQAISIVYRALPKIKDDPSDLELRRLMQTGAVFAGLAMGTTQTALAHSISYPFTARLGLPHGLACSFTLAEIARFNTDADQERMIPIATGLSCSVDEIPEVLEKWFDNLNLAQTVGAYLDVNAADLFGDDLINRSRAANNIREADGQIARDIVRRALARIFGKSPQKNISP